MLDRPGSVYSSATLGTRLDSNLVRFTHHMSFPGNKVETTDLSPLEVALESVENKTRDLKNVVETKPFNAKMLQLQLQGAVMTSVNEGPAHIAKVFLGEIALTGVR